MSRYWISVAKPVARSSGSNAQRPYSPGELYDGFTFNCLSWLEGLGFCGIGEAKEFLDGGKNIAREGIVVLNIHGGQLTEGRLHGMGLVREAVVQLRGDWGARRVERAKEAVVSSGCLTPAGEMLLRSDT